MGAISVGLWELNLLAHTQERTGKETRQNFCFSLVFLRWERELRCWWGWSSFKEIIVNAGEGQVLELGCQMYWARTLAEGSEQMGSLRLRWWRGRCYLQCQGLRYDHGSEWLRWVEDEIISWPWIIPPLSHGGSPSLEREDVVLGTLSSSLDPIAHSRLSRYVYCTLTSLFQRMTITVTLHVCTNASR